MKDLIPQTDPRASYLAQRAAIDAAIARVLESGRYILGAEVAAFESEFALWTRTSHAVGVASGTDALILGLKALGITAGDLVATVSHTAVATVAAIEAAGAVPVLVDIDRGYGMAVDSLAATLRARPVKAILPVHLYGQSVAIDAIMALARCHGVPVLEDCSQAPGASYAGRLVGGFGCLATYSFYPTKNLGAIGDGGVVVTADADLAQRLRELREYGWRDRVSVRAGLNSRLDELQAAILRVKLPRLGADNLRRRAIADAYDVGLADIAALIRPWRRPDTTHVFHQYVVRHARRDALREALQAQGVLTGVHYPLAAHQQPAYRDRVALGPTGLAETERAAATVVSLPIYPQMTPRQVDAVIGAIRNACAAI